MLTDTHTHLYSEAFDEDRDAMMRRAEAAQVKRFLFQLSIQAMRTLCLRWKLLILIRFF